jgi:hypothetical protein
MELSMAGNAAFFEATPSKVIYIAGYGRSGSTLLESVLNCHDAITVLGELSYLPESLNTLCSCGFPLRDCIFWRPIWDQFQEKAQLDVETFLRLQHHLESSVFWRSKAPFLPGRMTLREYYDRQTRLLFECIVNNTAADTQCLMDSSKTAYTAARKPKHLYRIFGGSLRVIHLIRDIRGVMWSMVHKGIYLPRSDGNGTARSRLAAFRAILGWITANHAANQLKTVLPEKCYTRVRYEDFVESPEATLLSLGKFLNMDMDGIISRVRDGLEPGEKHQIMGNPSRFDKVIKIKADYAWKKELPTGLRLLCRLMAGRFMVKYGYNL